MIDAKFRAESLSGVWSNTLFQGIDSWFNEVNNSRLIKEAHAESSKPRGNHVDEVVLVRNQTHLCNIVYNQRPGRAAKLSGDPNQRGLLANVEEAFRRVEKHSDLIAHTDDCLRFIGQNARVVAASLCNSVQKWMHFNHQIEMPDFPDFYIGGVNRGAYRWYKGDFCNHDEKILLQPWSDFSNYHEWNSGHHSREQMVKAFLETGFERALVRIRGKHTFSVVREGDKLIMGDTYHNKWTGLDLALRKFDMHYLYYWDLS